MGSYHISPRAATIAVLLVACVASVFLTLSCGDDSPTRSTASPSFGGLPMSRVSWHAASRPVTVSHGDHQGRMLWHLPYYLPRRNDVYSDSVAHGEAEVRTLRLIYRPDFFVFGTGGSLDTFYYASWAGIMMETDAPFDTANQFLDIRLKAPHGRMYIELGRIDEDVNGDGISFGEDDPPHGDGNGVVSDSEDVGLDGLPDSLEPDYDPDRNPDPNHDNWYFRGVGKCPYPPGICESQDFQQRMENPDDPLYYEWLNGTEGNMHDGANAQKPDQERLLGYFDTDNHYVSFLLDFNDHPDSFYVDGSEFNGWRTYRIPFKDTDAAAATIGNNIDWTRLTHARVWFESDGSATGFDTVEIAVAFRQISNDCRRFTFDLPQKEIPLGEAEGYKLDSVVERLRLLCHIPWRVHITTRVAESFDALSIYSIGSFCQVPKCSHTLFSPTNHLKNVLLLVHVVPENVLRRLAIDLLPEPVKLATLTLP